MALSLKTGLSLSALRPRGGGTAPSFTANHTLTANELTITADSVTGDPTPTVTLTTLTLDGVDVLADASGGFPSWTYFIPSAATVVYGLTATNGVSPDATDGATVVYAPADTTAPTFDPISYTAATRTLTLPNLDEGGTVVWATSDTANTPTFTVAGGWAGDANYETGSAAILPGESVVLDITATTPDGSRKLTVYVYDAANNLSSPDNATITVDNTAATLSAATGTQTGQTTATWGVTSNEAGGTIYAGVRPSASSALTAAQLIAGSGGAGVAWDSDTTPTADSANGGSFTGLTAATAYRVDVVQVDSFGNESTVASSAEFTTASAGPNFVEFHAAEDYFDMNADTAALATSAAAFTYAAKFKVTASMVGNIVNVATAGASSTTFLQFSNSGGLRLDLYDTNGTRHYFEIEGVSPALVAGDELALLWEATATGSTIRYAVNGGSVVTVNKTYSSTGFGLTVPYVINSVNPPFEEEGVGVGGIWVSLDGGSGATWGDFFDGSNDPTTAMVNGSTINSLNADFYESGNAAVWNARTGMLGSTGAVTDI